MASVSAIKQLCSYGIGLFMMKGLSLIMLPVLANALTQEELGRLELLTSIAVFFAILISFALHEVLYRFVSDVEQNKQQSAANKIYCLSLMFSLSALPILSAFSLIAARYTDSIMLSELLLISFALSFEGAIGISLAWLRMQDRARAFVTISLMTCICQAGFVLLSLKLQAGVSGILLASVSAHFLQLVVLHMVNRFSWTLPPAGDIRQYVKYGIPVAASGLLAFGLNGAEKLILGVGTDYQQLAVYAIAAKFALAMCILVQPFGMWWMPKRFSTLNQNQFTTFTSVTQYGVIWIALLSTSIAFAAPVFIHHMLPQSYQAAAGYTAATLAIALFKELSELSNIGILYKKTTGILLRINIAATLVALILATVLISYSVWGVLAALFIAQLLRFIAITVISHKLYPLQYQNRALALLVSVCCGYLLLSYYVSDIRVQYLMTFIAPLSIVLISYLTGLLPAVSGRSTLNLIRRKADSL